MIRIGFVGTGSFAIKHAQILVGLGFLIHGCYGTNQNKNERFKNIFKCKIYESLQDMINKKNIDVLYIVIPPYAHDGTPELIAIKNNIPFYAKNLSV